MYSDDGIYPNGARCSHITVLEDDASGTVVCTECGLVLIEQIYSQTLFHSLPLHKKTKDDEDFWVRTIKDLLHKWPQVEGKMCDIIYQRYQDERKKLLDKKKHIRLLACITYNELTKAGYGCLPNDVAQLFGLKTSDVCYFQHLLTSKVSPEIIPISNRYCSLLNLPFKDKELIGTICDTLKEEYNTNLKTLCILIMWYYCVHKYPNLYSLQYIANTCESNYQHLKKVIKKPGWSRLEDEVARILIKEESIDEKNNLRDS